MPRSTRAKLLWIGALALAPLLLLAGAAAPPTAAQQATPQRAAQPSPSAWEALLERDPAAVDDESLDALTRRVLHSLTPEQAAALAAGASPEKIFLPGGESLAEHLARSTVGGPGLVYEPVDQCVLFATNFQTAPVTGAMAADEVREYVVRGAGMAHTDQGGAPTCLIPDEAVAVVMHFRVVAAGVPNAKGFLRAWAADAPEPSTPVVDYEPLIDPPATVRRVFNGTAVVELCPLAGCAGGEIKVKTVQLAAHVRGDVTGFFRPTVAVDAPEVGDVQTLGGMDKSAFAAATHTHDGGDIVSGTVGEPFVDSTIARDDEVVPAVLAGDGDGSGLDVDLLDGLHASAFRPRPQNVVYVAADGTGDFTTISAALASITTATAGNRFLVVVGPGTYAEQVMMKPFVDIQGKGKKATIITSGSVAGPQGTVECADDAELRHLTVVSTGGLDKAIAIRCFKAAPMLTHVKAKAAGATGGGPLENIGLLNDGAGAMPMLTGSTAYATAAPPAAGFGVVNQNGAAPTIRDSSLVGFTAAIENRDTATAKIANTAIDGGADVMAPATQSSYACVRAYDAGTLQKLNFECNPNTPPTALDDAYSTLGNTLLEVTLDHAGAASLDNTTATQPSVIGETTTPKTFRSVFENDTDAETADKNDLTAAVVGGTVTAGAVVNMFADGTFEYTPPVGVTGPDTFDYTVTDPGGLMDTGTVTVNVGSVIWFVDKDNGGTADGRSTTPFTSLAPLDGAGGAGDPDLAGHTIFVFDETTGSTADGIELENNQVLHGNGVALVPAGFEYAGGGDLVAAGIAPMLGSAGDVVELADGNTVRGLDIAATAGRAIFGNASAGATITEVGTTGTGTGTGVRFDNATGTFTINDLDVSSSTGAGIDIQGGSATFTFDGASSITGVAAEGINVNGGTATLSFPGNITHSTGTAALRVTNHATGTIGLGGTNSITTGTGLQFSNADGTYNVNTMAGSTTLNGGDAGIDILGGSTGTFTFANISITDPTGHGFNLDTSTGGNVTYNGTISKTNVASPASAVRINAKTGGSVSFTGSIIGNTATADAIDLTSNAGGSFTFSGLLDLDTTTGTGFNATGGGTVQAPNAGNTVTSVGDGVGSGIGVNIGAAIGGLGVTFSSVDAGSSGKANSGILLANTGNTGTFSVTGGTIENVTNRGFHAANVNGTVSIGADIQNDGGRSVEITGSEGQFTFDGAIDDDAVGINISSNNTGSPTFTFRGGIDVDTIFSNTGFRAFSGGTLDVCADTNCSAAGGTPVVNSIDTTAGDGTAISIDSVTIGGEGVTFESIDVDAGSGPAIRLDTTGAGAFTVTGVDGPCGNPAATDCDGGTLANITGDAVYLENTDGPVSISNMLIQDIGDMSGGIDTLSGHDAFHGQSVDGGLTLDNVTIRRISDMAINGTLHSPMGGDPTTVWNGLTITDSHIANTNRFDPALATVADDSDEGGVRILGLRGTTLLDGNVFERGGTLVQFFVTSSTGPLPATTTITVTENDFLTAYKEFATGGVLSKGITCLDVIAQATGNVNLTVGSRSTSTVGHQAGDDGNLFLNCHGASLRYGNDSVSVFGLPAHTGDVDADVGNNTFRSTDHDSAQNGDFDFPRGYLLAITRGLDSATLDTRIAYNLFDEVSFEGGLGQLNLDFEDGIHQAKVDFNTFDTPGHAPWFVRADSSASAEVLFRDNTGIRGPFCSGDPSAAGGGCDLGGGNLCIGANPANEGYCGPGESATASAQSLGDLDMGIIDDTFALEDAYYTIGETVRIRTVNTGGSGTICAYLEDNTSPNGYGLEEDAGTLELEQGGSASTDPATVLGDNNNTGTPKNVFGGVTVTAGTCNRPTGSLFN